MRIKDQRGTQEKERYTDLLSQCRAWGSSGNHGLGWRLAGGIGCRYDDGGSFNGSSRSGRGGSHCGVHRGAFQGVHQVRDVLLTSEANLAITYTQV